MGTVPYALRSPLHAVLIPVGQPFQLSLVSGKRAAPLILTRAGIRSRSAMAFNFGQSSAASGGFSFASTPAAGEQQSQIPSPLHPSPFAVRLPDALLLRIQLQHWRHSNSRRSSACQHAGWLWLSVWRPSPWGLCFWCSANSRCVR